MAWITMARNTRRRTEARCAEPDTAAARVDAIRAARFASNKVAAERLERALRAAERDAADSPFSAPAPASPASRPSAA